MDPTLHNSGIDFQFKGSAYRKNYFEGWYLKFILDDHNTISLIPSLHRQGQLVQASLQTIFSKDEISQTVSSTYSALNHQITFPFEFRLGENLISSNQIIINEPHLKLQAEIQHVVPYPRNIMGPFQFFHTIMPCNHGLLAMRGKAKVKVSSDLIQGSYEAQLYVEKDWGDTFPDRYIWIHADFPKENVALFFSVATVRVGKLKFPGFIANILIDEEHYTFATWNLAQLKVTGSPTDIRIDLANKDMKVTLHAHPQHMVNLHSPIDGIMNSSIREALSAPLQMILQLKSGKTLKLTTQRASVEYHNWFDNPIDSLPF